ncbi:hypothetical protein HFO42_29980 [Rhizobium leguminosarum]|uniref:Uncharacterized protein n=1 Tax=Rhizobium leguminosarum TaxID=384 RepID=A0AAJ1AE81_RHILE|nr:hypothetical protein [Rhizobium leguminosarum]MBY5537561.1 hypothetical protein [Rhizobium leguminosarum]MBY5565197.1 hypothetical protein [Rhizobium leguminosarum]MBY5598552.1 hypothetical protein [Rhizobium leguminosarum]MBY5632282.1 hypothetical protein [Rhizobium leguminosarum]MBY5652564.1 hypothetical protein [Rhizobium leguminosarum]
MAMSLRSSLLAPGRLATEADIRDGFAVDDLEATGLEALPFRPVMRVTARLIWSRHHPFSRLAEAFLTDVEATLKSAQKKPAK